MGLGAGRKGRGRENEGAREAVERVGRLGDMALIEAAGRKVGSVVWWAWKISYFS